MASLVVQTSFLGDVILTTPLIAELALRGAVDVVTTPAGAAILDGNPAVRNVIIYDKRGADRGPFGFARVVARIREAGGPRARGASPERYAEAYLAQGSARSSLLVFSAGIGVRIGFDTSAGRTLYTRRVEYRTDRHHAERLWWLSMSACADPPGADQIRPRLYPSKTDADIVDTTLREARCDGAPILAIAPGSAWGTKRWPFYPELAVRAAEQFCIAVIGGKSDAAAGDTLVAQLPPGRGVNTAGRLGVLASAELVRRSAALVTNDSAPQHLASATGTPTVTIFGPTVPAFGFGPLAPRSVTVGRDDLACRPCHPHGPERCPLGHWRCMRELSSREVHELLMRTLSRAT